MKYTLSLKRDQEYDEPEDAFKWGMCFGMIEGALIFVIVFLALSLLCG